MPLSLDRQNAYRKRYARAHPGWRPATERYEMLIRAHLRPGMTVLDLGCGRGGVLEQLGAAVERPIGLDPDFASLREHRLPDLQLTSLTPGRKMSGVYYYVLCVQRGYSSIGNGVNLHYFFAFVNPLYIS